MNKFQLRTHNAVVAGGVVTLVAIVIFALLQTSATASKQANSEESFWKQQIEQRGASQAYGEFADTIEQETFGRQHDLAHVFGGALYAQEGLPGLIVCDKRFDYGCFHEFLGRAIAEHGVRSVTDLNNTCIQLLGDNAGYCQHGIGHGIQSYYGYQEQDVQNSLALCDSLPDNDPIGGCAGGVFMEYNLRTMLGSDRVIRGDTNILAPCDSLDGWNQKACYFWQSQWWYEQLITEEDSIEGLFKTLGARCDTIESRDARDFCYNGIGNLMQARGGDNEPSYCDVVSTDEHNTNLCWAYVD